MTLRATCAADLGDPDSEVDVACRQQLANLAAYRASVAAVIACVVSPTLASKWPAP